MLCLNIFSLIKTTPFMYCLKEINTSLVNIRIFLITYYSLGIQITARLIYIELGAYVECKIQLK